MNTKAHEYKVVSVEGITPKAAIVLVDIKFHGDPESTRKKNPQNLR
jgi:hypothetical protein